MKIISAKDANTHTLSSKVWYHLLTLELPVLRNYQQTPSKIVKNQGENKNRNNIFYSHEFIHANDLIRPLSNFHILLSNVDFRKIII